MGKWEKISILQCCNLRGLFGIICANLVRSVAQSGSAFASGAKGRGFKSLRSDHPEN